MALALLASSTAIRLKQLAEKAGKEINVVVLEKGSEPGAHILSGAVMDPIAMSELFPNWKELGAPEPTRDRRRSVGADRNRHHRHAKALIPNNFHNEGNYVISLGNVVRWLGQQAEALGGNLPGFAAAEVLYNDDGSVKGVATGNLGIDKNGEPTTANSSWAWNCWAEYTIFAEGARGHLGKQLIAKFKLDEGKDPQSYAIGIKELWEVDPAKAKPGLVVHTAGWPMDTKTYGGGFLYHLEDNKVTLGFVTGLDYQNPGNAHLRKCSVEDPPQHQAFAGRCQAFELRRSCHHRRRHLVAAQDRVPWWCTGGCDAGYPNAARIMGCTPP